MGTDLETQIAFLGVKPLEVVPVGPPLTNLIRQAVYTDEWLTNEMQEMKRRLSVHDPELLSEVNSLTRRLEKLESAYETLLERIKRTERK